jgi:hypothetical protein
MRNQFPSGQFNIRGVWQSSAHLSRRDAAVQEAKSPIDRDAERAPRLEKVNMEDYITIAQQEYGTVLRVASLASGLTRKELDERYRPLAPLSRAASFYLR